LVVAGLVTLSGAATPRVSRADAWYPTVEIRAAVADFNGDGTTDAATVVGKRLRVTVSHRGTVELPHARHIIMLAAADVDGDGHTDLIALTRRGALRVFRNDGAGHLSAVRPRQPQSRRFGDSPNGTLRGDAAQHSTTETRPRNGLLEAGARVVRYPVLVRAGPGVPHGFILPLTDTSSRSPRAPPFHRTA
jgi:hypothetical protein